MIKDSERGLGYLLGHEEPETKARRVAELKRQFESSAPMPLSNPMDVFTSLPLATEVNLGTRNSLATPEITSPVKPKRKQPTKREIYKGMMEWAKRPKLTEQEKEFWGAWNNSDKMLKYVKKYTDEDEERFNDRIQEQDRISVSNNKVKGLSYFPRNEIADRNPKILKTKIGDVKVISTTQKDITNNNKQGRKVE